ncbi:hypothetical protein LRR81_15030 [Metabacillus sp. GX 13764]|uniref:hypothetical protein n=1 Tax=Metabacillus kandeliae TaxID=2900151 RepID=UPI001E304BBA|nr:hypothetical protein [Metabacillus kandeliae]
MKLHHKIAFASIVLSGSLLSVYPGSAALAFDASKQAMLLQKDTASYNQTINSGNLQKLDSSYDSFTSSIKKTELAIGKTSGKSVRQKLNETYIRPAKIAKERVIYEISEYRLLNYINSKLVQANIETADADFAKLNRLHQRSISIKAAGNYKALPAAISRELDNMKQAQLKKYHFLKESLNPNNPDFLFPRLTELKNKWESLSEQSKKDYARKDSWTLEGYSKYLGYLPKHTGFLYHLTGDQEYKKMTSDFIALYRKFYMYDGKLMSPEYAEKGWWYRDPFARDSNSLFEAYKYTGSKEILSFVDEQAALWIKKVPRENNNGYTVFPYGISSKGEIGPIEINPNQNLQIAMLFSSLYWEPESDFYQSSLAKSIVMNETEAVLSLQKPNGALPLTENLPLVEDTNYGGYSGNMLYELSQMWGKEKWIESTADIGRWLFKEYTMDHPWNLPEDKPNYAIDRQESFNLISRTLQFYAAGIPDASVKSWISFAERKFPDEKLYLLERWYFYQSIPRDYLDSRITLKNQLPPQMYAELTADQASVRIAAEELNSWQITVKNTENGQTVLEKTAADDAAFEMTLPKGSYQVTIEAAEANGKITKQSKMLAIDGDNTVIPAQVLLFDRDHRFFEKIK